MRRPPTAPKRLSGQLSLIVEGFKCLRDRQEFELAPLTVLAGANSSGKSSAMQPLLLLKQTLEASFNPGALLIDGPMAAFTKADQLVWRGPSRPGKFVLGMMTRGVSAETEFGVARRGLEISQCGLRSAAAWASLSPGSQPAELAAFWDSVVANFKQVVTGRNDILARATPPKTEFSFEAYQSRYTVELYARAYGAFEGWVDPWERFSLAIRDLLHLPGLRGNPAREYRLVQAPKRLEGSFLSEYVASLLWDWQEAGDARIGQIGSLLRRLGLTWKVVVAPQSDVAGELRVGRLPNPARGGARDLVNIADVGFGVSQVLPILVALLVARQGQLVYIEQPELHLHPEAQAELASILVDHAKRGVRVIIETHSPLLLIALQTAVAAGDLPPDKVRLYWFERDDEGAAIVTSGSLDERGRYLQWPVDFSAVQRRVDEEYLKEALHRGK